MRSSPDRNTSSSPSSGTTTTSSSTWVGQVGKRQRDEESEQATAHRPFMSAMERTIRETFKREGRIIDEVKLANYKAEMKKYANWLSEVNSIQREEERRGNIQAKEMIASSAKTTGVQFISGIKKEYSDFYPAFIPQKGNQKDVDAWQKKHKAELMQQEKNEKKQAATRARAERSIARQAMKR